MTRWEYEYVRTTYWIQDLDIYGKGGWELVSVVPDGGGMIFFFKRPLETA